MKQPSLDELRMTIGHAFNNIELLKQALTHSSYANESGVSGDYERLEFLGDAVLELVVSHMLVDRYPDRQEGELSRMRASAVNKRTLAAIARRLGIGEHIRMSFGEEKTGGREKDTLLADVFEALVGAIYLDAGLGAAAAFIERYFDMLFAGISKNLLFVDYKTRLQEIAQARFQATPIYRTVSTSGPDHQKTFVIEVMLNKKVYGRGEGRSKKEAEQNAAQQAHEALTVKKE